MLFDSYPDEIDEIMEYHLANNATIRFVKFKFIVERILKEEYTKEMEKALCERFSDLVVSEIVDCPYVDGAEQFLKYFSELMPIYLVSVNPQNELEQILDERGLSQYFKKVYADPWKKPDAFREILQQENVMPEDAVFIGDTYEDYRASVEVGIPFIGRDSKKSFRDADIIICKDMFEVKNKLV